MNRESRSYIQCWAQCVDCEEKNISKKGYTIIRVLQVGEGVQISNNHLCIACFHRKKMDEVDWNYFDPEKAMMWEREIKI